MTAPSRAAVSFCWNPVRLAARSAGVYLELMHGSSLVLASADPARSRRLHQALEGAGYLVDHQTNAEGAAQALRGRDLEVLVLDTQLPGIDLSQLSDALLAESTLPPEPLEAVERHHIVRTLRHTNGNRRHAALLLGIARSTLLAKMRRHRISDPFTATP